MPLNVLRSLFGSFALTAAPIAVNSLIQGLAVALTLALCLKLASRISAAHRFALWFAGFIAVAALPFVSFVFHAANVSAVLAGDNTPTPHAWLQFDARWTFAIAALWLLASMARAADLAFHILRLRRLSRTATPVNAPAIAGTNRAGTDRTVEICTTQSLDRPSVIGFFTPRILIPGWLLPRLTSDELHQIVLHESEHLRRHDDWTNLFQKLCLVLFPLNAALWVIDRQLAKERERSCDEAVVRITQAPRAYAACLASLAERGIAHRTEALSLGAWQRRSELVDRVHRILRSNRLMHPIAAHVLLGVLGCSLVVVSAELASSPQLVAFASPTHAAASLHADAASQLRDAVYPTDPRRAVLPPGMHVLQAKAEMPAAPIMKPFASRAHFKSPSVGELRAASSEPGIPAHNPRTVAGQQTGTAAQPATGQQLIVFTAWEQIEITPQVVADYNADATASSGNPASPATVASRVNIEARASAQRIPTRQITVTRLIFRVVPANSKSTFDSAQPAAIPLGWFVIQL